MGLDREIEAMRRRLNKIVPQVRPPQLKFLVFNEGEKNPTSGSQWELSCMIERKPEGWIDKEH